MTPVALRRRRLAGALDALSRRPRHGETSQLSDNDRDWAYRRAVRVAACGEQARPVCACADCGDKARIAICRCGHHGCPECQGARARVERKKLLRDARRIERMPAWAKRRRGGAGGPIYGWRVLTLTSPRRAHSLEELRADIRLLKRHLRALWRWTKTAAVFKHSGGRPLGLRCYLEVGAGADHDGGDHAELGELAEAVDGAVHAHVLFAGPYWAQRSLSKAWEEISGASVVWISEAYDRRAHQSCGRRLKAAAAAEIAKYLAAPKMGVRQAALVSVAFARRARTIEFGVFRSREGAAHGTCPSCGAVGDCLVCRELRRATEDDPSDVGELLEVCRRRARRQRHSADAGDICQHCGTRGPPRRLVGVLGTCAPRDRFPAVGGELGSRLARRALRITPSRVEREEWLSRT